MVMKRRAGAGRSSHAAVPTRSGAGPGFGCSNVGPSAAFGPRLKTRGVARRCDTWVGATRDRHVADSAFVGSARRIVDAEVGSVRIAHPRCVEGAGFGD